MPDSAAGTFGRTQTQNRSKSWKEEKYERILIDPQKTRKTFLEIWPRKGWAGGWAELDWASLSKPPAQGHSYSYRTYVAAYIIDRQPRGAATHVKMLLQIIEERKDILLLEAVAIGPAIRNAPNESKG